MLFPGYSLQGKMMYSRKKICFVSPENAALLFPEFAHLSRYGGSQVQQHLISNMLYRKFDTHFVVENIGQGERDLCRDGIKIHTAYKRNRGIRFLRFFHPRWTGLWHAMHRANADYYYQRAAGSLTGIVAMFCKINKKKFVYAMANDNELLKIWDISQYALERKLFEYGLKKADCVLVQNTFQQEELGRQYNLKGKLIRNVYHGTISDEIKKEKNYVIVVSNIQPKKQYEIMLNVAEKLKEIHFQMIGKGEGLYFKKIFSKCNKLSNVKLYTDIKRDELLDKYQNAYLLLHTAKAEGFPNVFLEAWARGIPVVSLKIDPDGVIGKHRLGFVIQNISELIAAVTSLINNRKMRQSMGVNCVKYVKDYHAPEIIKESYKDVFQRIDF